MCHARQNMLGDPKKRVIFQIDAKYLSISSMSLLQVLISPVISFVDVYHKCSTIKVRYKDGGGLACYLISVIWNAI